MTARDILTQVELASGLELGLIRDAVTIANDASASLAEGGALRLLCCASVVPLLCLCCASAVMTPHDCERLDGLLAALEAQRAPSAGICMLPSAGTDALVEVATSTGLFARNGRHHPSENSCNG
jgi:hypothetical protein